MKWIYYFDKKWDEKGQSTSGKIYFRPIKYNENGEHMAGNMVILNVFAAEVLMADRAKLAQNEEQKQYIYDIYFEKLKDKDYFFRKEWRPKGHEDYLLCGGSLYLKVMQFNQADLVGWIKVFFQLEGMPCDDLEEKVYGDFADENPLMRMLQKSAIEGEKTFGKEWWNKKNK